MGIVFHMFFVLLSNPQAVAFRAVVTPVVVVLVVIIKLKVPSLCVVNCPFLSVLP